MNRRLVRARNLPAMIAVAGGSWHRAEPWCCRLVVALVLAASALPLMSGGRANAAARDVSGDTLVVVGD